MSPPSSFGLVAGYLSQPCISACMYRTKKETLGFCFTICFSVGWLLLTKLCCYFGTDSLLTISTSGLYLLKYISCVGENFRYPPCEGLHLLTTQFDILSYVILSDVNFIIPNCMTQLKYTQNVMWETTSFIFIGYRLIHFSQPNQADAFVLFNVTDRSTR